MTSNRVSVARRTQKDVYEKAGRAGGECPRMGYIRLEGEDGTVNYAKTVCKTWRCLPCRKKLVALVRMKLEYGLSRLEGCLFITLTLRLAKGMLPEDVDFVQGAWRRLLALLKKKYPEWKKAKWFKVVEFTRSQQPHLHLIFQTGILGEKTSCLLDQKNPKWNRRAFVVGDCPESGTCVHHRVAKTWLDVVGSWVIDVQLVVAPERTAKYLCKYLTKTLTRAYDENVKNRRWSKSNNWPKLERLQYLGSYQSRWKKIKIIGGYNGDLEERVKASEKRQDPMMMKVGSKYVKDWQEKRMKKATAIKFGKLLGV